MAGKKKRLVIFTDLDGTLLDAESYSFDQALPALEQIRNTEIPDPMQNKYLHLSKIWAGAPLILTRHLGPKIISEIGL